MSFKVASGPHTMVCMSYLFQYLRGGRQIHLPADISLMTSQSIFLVLMCKILDLVHRKFSLNRFLGFMKFMWNAYPVQKILIWMKPPPQNRSQQEWQTVSRFALDTGKAASLSRLTGRLHKDNSPSLFKIKPSNSLPQMGNDNHLPSVLGHGVQDAAPPCPTGVQPDGDEKQNTQAGTGQGVSKLTPASIFTYLWEFFRFKVCACSQVVLLWIYWATRYKWNISKP